jgi:hypothetical protein
MVVLPESFLRWNYFPRREALLQMVNGYSVVDADRFFFPKSEKH